MKNINSIWIEQCPGGFYVKVNEYAVTKQSESFIVQTVPELESKICDLLKQLFSTESKG